MRLKQVNHAKPLLGMGHGDWVQKFDVYSLGAEIKYQHPARTASRRVPAILVRFGDW